MIDSEGYSEMDGGTGREGERDGWGCAYMEGEIGVGGRDGE